MNRIYSEFENLLSKNHKEEVLHKYIYTHSYLISNLGYGVKLVFSKPSFGSNFRADFAIVGWGNYYCWTFVEIERNTHKLFTKEGLPSQALNRAMNQLNSWWIWLYDYGEYASSEFYKISGENTAAIVIGRRNSMSQIDIRRLQHLNASQLGGKLKIVTYDVLLDNIRSYSNEEIKFLESKHEKMTRFKNIKEWIDYQEESIKK